MISLELSVLTTRTDNTSMHFLASFVWRSSQQKLHDSQTDETEAPTFGVYVILEWGAENPVVFDVLKTHSTVN